MSVAAKLIDPSFNVPADVQAEVNADLASIDAHSGLMPSAVMGIGGEEYMEDFSQYVPRGHYTRSDDLKRYFKTMMWFGRITFRLRDTDETRSALLLTQALRTAKSGSQPASQLWDLIYEPTTFFVGGSDDLTYLDYAPLMDQALGPNAAPSAIADDAKIAAFLELAKSLAAPRINSMFVYITEDKEQATKGFRMMGQRFTLDEYVFGQLIYRNVGTRTDPRAAAQRPRCARRFRLAGSSQDTGADGRDQVHELHPANEQGARARLPACPIPSGPRTFTGPGSTPSVPCLSPRRPPAATPAS